MMDAKLIIEGAQALGISMQEDTIARLIRFSEEVLRVNQVMNLTAITDENEFIIRHLIDSLTLLKTGLIQDGKNLIDVGCGAGFPSMPLQIAVPGIRCTMLDGVGKRVRFLEEAGALCNVTGARYVHGRAEELAHQTDYRERYDIATARGVASLSALCEYCLPFVKPGGVFLAMKGENPAEELAAGKNAIGTLGGSLQDVLKVTLPGTEITHTVIIIKKISQSNLKYPRIQAKIKKNPL
jgi:16S rRNA (guanine527-N7)-methyltransferase